MASTSRTAEFRQLLREKEAGLPDAKRRRVSRAPRRPDGQSEGELSLRREYIAEAYVVLNHINTLARMISSVRKAYLNLDSRAPPISRQGTRTIDLSGAEQTWADVKHLTNEERDQIDLQARVILSRCSDRVKELEAVEKRRVNLAASRKNPLLKFLPARMVQDAASASSDFVAAHHASITWYLSRRLTDASQSLKEMQEERMRRQMERTRTLGASAGLYADLPEQVPSPAESSASGSWIGGATNLASSFVAKYGAAGASSAGPPSGAISDFEDETDEEEIELTASQIQQFETENANILQSVQDTLASVQQAESRLLEISALQMELVAHLTRQTEQTEQLYEDAIATAATVEKGNVQLREAKRRARDSRKWILMFLIGASLSLLFLHYY